METGIPQEVMALLQQLSMRVEEQSSELARLRAAQDVQSAQASRVRLDSDLQMNGASTSSGQASMTIDTRQLGKPEHLKGDSNQYADWSFVFKAYMSCISHKYLDLFERLEQSRMPVLNRSLSDSDKALSAQLYFVLVMLVKGRPLDIVQNAGQGEGAEAFRKLEELYHPRIASRFVGSLSQILCTRFTSSDVEEELELFKKTIRRYEAESGKTLDDEVLLGVVINGLQDSEVRNHILRSSSRLTSYQAVRTELLEMARATRVINNLPQPMEIGGAPKGKWTAKGEKAGKKGKDKGIPGTGKGPGNSLLKTCLYCGKPGHVKAECRKRKADEKSKGKEGKGNKGGKAKGGKRGNAALPEEEPQGEPLSSVVGDEEILAATVSGKDLILVDTGAGSNLFTKGFDLKARDVAGTGGGKLVTVTERQKAEHHPGGDEHRREQAVHCRVCRERKDAVQCSFGGTCS